MKLIVELAGSRIEPLYLHDAVALLQLESVLNRHTARGHTVEVAEDSFDVDRFLVVTPEGTIKYWLEP